MARKRNVARSDTSHDDLASEPAEGGDLRVEMLAKRLHDCECEFPWETSSPDHREAWMNKARAVA